jgi:RNase P subunit RPR2
MSNPNLEQRVATLEEQVQEQYEAKCKYYNKVNNISLPRKIKLKYCMHCGGEIDYSLSKKPS